jgi:chromosomal replication initiator protein
MFVAAYRNTERGITRKFSHETEAIITKARAEAGAIIAEARQEAEKIVEYARDRANRILAPEANERIPVPELIGFVAAKHCISYDTITGDSRTGPIVNIRHEAMALVYEKRPDLSLPQIGKFFGGRDHSTILHAVRKLGVHRANGYRPQERKP